jgi:hypothetical protein
LTFNGLHGVISEKAELFKSKIKQSVIQLYFLPTLKIIGFFLGLKKTESNPLSRLPLGGPEE